jgi:hypothetical protein
MFGKEVTALDVFAISIKLSSRRLAANGKRDEQKISAHPLFEC